MDAYRANASVVRQHQARHFVLRLDIGAAFGQSYLNACWTPWYECCQLRLSNAHQTFVHLNDEV